MMVVLSLGAATEEPMKQLFRECISFRPEQCRCQFVPSIRLILSARLGGRHNCKVRTKSDVLQAISAAISLVGQLSGTWE